MSSPERLPRTSDSDGFVQSPVAAGVFALAVQKALRRHAAMNPAFSRQASKKFPERPANQTGF
jgi:hypothetical protein